ncbi:type II toxin-antitoxin system RelE/ParE family toxin, partial [Actinocrinis sp.]|uniref:type II toxin-antitoxin system RelE/ParE family toxin n=1 Tax=Actinocrinis sp. TaxID=1920516 RepID=UPI0039C85784
MTPAAGALRAEDRPLTRPAPRPRWRSAVTRIRALAHRRRSGKRVPEVRGDLISAGSAQASHNIRVIKGGTLELEPEVEEWYGKLDDTRRAQAYMHFELLEEMGISLGMPYARQLNGQLWELRFYCGGVQQRVSYWIAPGRRIVLLTV